MTILFTGSSSFTGYWFIRTLSIEGHKIIATFTKKSVSEYEGIRKQRVEELLNYCTPVWNCYFGSNQFLELIDSNVGWDLLCHHAAYVKDYKSDDFDYITAIKTITYNARKVFSSLEKKGCKKILLTGSVFEGNEGVGSEIQLPFSLYGYSKQVISQFFEFLSVKERFSFAKFVIPNPFGPYEEPRFTDYLIKSWVDKKIPEVRTPLYVRDNIHVELLAKCYAKFAETFVKSQQNKLKLNPSGYTESQGSFTERFSKEMSQRLKIDCQYKLKHQEIFTEPYIRINNYLAYHYIDSWNDETAWDNLAEYYKEKYSL